MKKRMMKFVTLITASVALVVVTVLITVAYLTSSSAVSNTFTVGNVGIKMYESKVDSDGQAIPDTDTHGTMKDSDGNNYHLMPGKTYDKDPTIYVDGASDKSYLFVKIRNNIEPIEKGNLVIDGTQSGVESTGSEENLTIAQQLKAKGWKDFINTSTGKVYIYVGIDAEGNLQNEAQPVGGNTDIKEIDVFDTFTIHEKADISLYGGAKVTLTAFAIQTDGFEDDPTGKTAIEKAWDAIVATYPYEDGAAIND